MADIPVTVRYVTADELWDTEVGDPSPRYELVEGELVEISPAGEQHGDLASEINMQIRAFVKANNLGRVTAAETGYVIVRASGEGGRDTVLAPDVGFVSAARVAPVPSKKYVPVAPDLAVEVASPHDSFGDIQRKVRLYLGAGTKLVWVVDPDTSSLTEFSADGVRVYSADQYVSGQDVLPGFTLNLSEIFPASPK